MYYFAYGSNMSLARMHRRVPSARRVSVATLPAHRLRFHKVGLVDGSGKCDAEYTGQRRDRVWGVVYRIDAGERARLDRVEGVGKGYRRVSVQVVPAAGGNYRCFTYLATRIDAGLRPFTWYKQHVLSGARENGLPDEYIGLIDAVAVSEDSDRQRHRREMAIHAAIPGKG